MFQDLSPVCREFNSLIPLPIEFPRLSCRSSLCAFATIVDRNQGNGFLSLIKEKDVLVRLCWFPGMVFRRLATRSSQSQTRGLVAVRWWVGIFLNKLCTDDLPGA